MMEFGAKLKRHSVVLWLPALFVALGVLMATLGGARFGANQVPGMVTDWAILMMAALCGEYYLRKPRRLALPGVLFIACTFIVAPGLIISLLNGLKLLGMIDPPSVNSVMAPVLVKSALNTTIAVLFSGLLYRCSGYRPRGNKDKQDMDAAAEKDNP